MNSQSSQDPAQVIGQEVDMSERLIWAGRPRQGIIFRASDLVMVPIGVLWCIFAISWLISIVRSGLPWILYAWSIPTVVMGVYAVAGRFYVDARMRAGTWYGVTSDRVMIITGVYSKHVTSITLETMGDITMTQEPDGSGSIVFGPSNPYASWYEGMPWYRTSGMGAGKLLPPAFEQIAHVKTVYDQIRQAQRAAGKDGVVDAGAAEPATASAAAAGEGEKAVEERGIEEDLNEGAAPVPEFARLDTAENGAAADDETEAV